MRLKLSAVAALLMVVAAASAHAASVDHAKELMRNARAELEAVLTSADASQDDRQQAVALLRQLSGGGEPTPSAEPSGTPPPPTFVDNGDGTATDSTTGLTWMTKDSGGPTTWEGALHYCQYSKKLGFHDWRLPVLPEMESLLRAGATDQQYRVPGFIHLSACAPWVANDDYHRGAYAEVDFCKGDNMVVMPTEKRAPAICVRGKQLPEM